VANVLFTNVRIFDGNGALPFSGDALTRGKHIQRVTRGARSMPVAGATVIDATGATLMPGMAVATR
jgi:dihydroorotase-like cyclic amidohydrolase